MDGISFIRFIYCRFITRIAVLFLRPHASRSGKVGGAGDGSSH